ncbi:hypothetical protein LWC34_34585 [Kibdelosporangium philippinense]|uniref:Uncharacterized protein n=1 Tax=Kibdelosporangium philippinense TaxID=211113 RepID=A0ABS8ZK96_9PSEU|nr:hypothetical protein [Kibdelosporangium philippinense]MCE7007912.1 hypothetical protein [Kibdelosporangium philippinense]
MTNLILSLILAAIPTTFLILRLRYRRQTVLQAAEEVQVQLRRREPSDPESALIRPLRVYPLSEDMIKDLVWVYGYRFVDDTLRDTQRYLRFAVPPEEGKRG